MLSLAQVSGKSINTQLFAKLVNPESLSDWACYPLMISFMTYPRLELKDLIFYGILLVILSEQMLNIQKSIVWAFQVKLLWTLADFWRGSKHIKAYYT